MLAAVVVPHNTTNIFQTTMGALIIRIGFWIYYIYSTITLVRTPKALNPKPIEAPISHGQLKGSTWLSGTGYPADRDAGLPWPGRGRCSIVMRLLRFGEDVAKKLMSSKVWIMKRL